ncbi:MAG: peptidase C39 [Candidatus Nealsonbacteria bacterium CG10_big_fil_rev_8_21_14_0_10_36_23]|uniref:Peptidase C39 n=1 Tax=Candidatus Nealsonbacteria bacterium CG10_big_fil_rev_8_21_14_0_10_36_23 TaxID=1974709 RepID=A0A2H0TL62_9BACT|nr:MAG: peptidase C39 [Candidatus Nealsonbacteria bacterium CG10_big_fil_rev_8_21_14_0_10_36_23]
MIKLKPFRQKPGLCGPASLKMVLDYYGFSISEAELAKLAGASKKKGASVEGLIKAAKHLGFQTFLKKKSSLNDLKYFIKRKIPVIVDWFFEDDGHYSVVIDIDKKNTILRDPSYTKRRKLSNKKFLRVWFDFPGEYIKDSKDLILKLMLVVTPFKEKFPVKGGKQI